MSNAIFCKNMAILTESVDIRVRLMHFDLGCKARSKSIRVSNRFTAFKTQGVLGEPCAAVPAASGTRGKRGFQEHPVNHVGE